MTLDAILADLKRRIGVETNPAKTEVFTVVANLVAALQANAKPDSRDAEVVELRERVAKMVSLLNNDTVTFLAIKIALGNPNLTQGELANEITTNWRHI